MPGIKRQVDLLQSTYSGSSRSSAYTASCVNLPAWGCSSSFWPSTPNMFAAGHRLKSLERRHNAHWPSRGMDRDPDAREILPFQCCDFGLADRRTIHSQAVMTKRSNSRTARVPRARTVPLPCQVHVGMPTSTPTPTGPPSEFAKAERDSQAHQRRQQ